MSAMSTNFELRYIADELFVYCMRGKFVRTPDIGRNAS